MTICFCGSNSDDEDEPRQPQRVELQVNMESQKCEREVKKAVKGMRGVRQVEVERIDNKVTVVGHVDPSMVVARIADRTGKKVQLWPHDVNRPNADDPLMRHTSIMYTGHDDGCAIM